MLRLRRNEPDRRRAHRLRDVLPALRVHPARAVEDKGTAQVIRLAIGAAKVVAVLFVAACVDEWQVWRRNRCVRKSMRREAWQAYRERDL